MQDGDGFREWMDGRKLGASEVCGPLGVSVQTIHNWRSAGVPRRRLPHVRHLMANWDAVQGNPLSTIVVRAEPVQFDRWNHAALAAGKLLTRWAVDALDEAARQCTAVALPKVADEAATAPAPPATATHYPVQRRPKS